MGNEELMLDEKRADEAIQLLEQKGFTIIPPRAPDEFEVRQPGFTAGPWTVQSRKKNRVCGPQGVIIAEAWVAPARAKRGAKQAAWEQAHANARLLAAAPNLYWALENLLSEIDALRSLNTSRSDSFGGLDPEIEAAEQALDIAVTIDAKLKEAV